MTTTGEAWRSCVRHCILCADEPFVEDGDLVWLAVSECREVDLMPLASLAECGHADCACNRSRHPEVRRRFRQEVVRKAVDARARGDLPADGRISYCSVGSGLLLGDFDVILGLQDAGFEIVLAAFIDSDYAENCHGALREVADFLAPSRVIAYASAADYVHARLHGQQDAAHIFMQIDVVEVSLSEAATLSALALDDGGGGLGFSLAHRHHPTLVPMVSWSRRPTPSSTVCADAHMRGGSSLSAAVLERLRAKDAYGSHADVQEDGAAQPLWHCNVSPADEYARVLSLVDPQALVEFDQACVPRELKGPPEVRPSAEAQSSGPER